MTLNKDQQTELEYLCDREATICAIVEILLDHKLTTCDELLTLKKKHFDKLKPAVEEAVERFNEPQQVKPAIPADTIAKTDNETADIHYDIKIKLSAKSYDEARRTIDRLKAACTGTYTFNVNAQGEFAPGINIGGLSTFNRNFNPSCMA